MTKEKKENTGNGFGIRAKLILVIIPVILVIILSFFALSRNEITKLSKEKLEAQSEVCAGKIYAWAEQILGELQIYQDTIEEGGFAGDEEILTYMRTSLDKNDAYPNGLYMGDDSGVYLDPTDWVPGDEWILTERDWYLEGKENSELAFGEPYYDSQTGDICVSVSVRMDYPAAVRVMATDVYLNYLSEVVSDINAEGSQSFLVTRQSQTIIAHPDADMIDVSLDQGGLDRLYAEVGGAVARDTRGLIDVRGDKTWYFVVLNEIPGTDWLLVSYMSKADVLRGLTRLEFIMAAIAVLAALVLLFLVIRLMNQVVKPVGRVTDVIQKVSEGDFSQNLEVRGNDEVARMSAHTQEFLLQMRKTISGIMEIAGWLQKQSVENGAVSDSLRDSAGNLSEAMAELDNMVDKLSADAQRVSEEMEHLAQAIERADSQGKHAGEMMRQTVEISESGRVAAEHVSEGMRHVEMSISALSEQLSQMNDVVERIGSMAEMIADVADETNLLSLNASIEAARAGEAGRGFAVVAEQIGKLAENSNQASGNISELITEIREKMQQVIDRMRESTEEVHTNTGLVDKNRTAFESVFRQVGEVNRTVEQMAETVAEAGRVSVRMREIAESQVAEADQITESARRLDTYTRQVKEDSSKAADSAKELERESANLMEQVSRFRIE